MRHFRDFAELCQAAGVHFGHGKYRVGDHESVDRFTHGYRRLPVESRRPRTCSRGLVQRNGRSRIPCSDTLARSSRHDVSHGPGSVRIQLRTGALAPGREPRARVSRQLLSVTPFVHSVRTVDRAAVEIYGHSKPPCVADLIGRLGPPPAHRVPTHIRKYL